MMARRIYRTPATPTGWRFTTAALALLAALASAACGGAGPEPDTAPPETPAPETAPPDTAPPAGADAVAETAETPDLAELEALYRARMDSARARHTEADVRFMQGMIVHHGQALVMVGLARDSDRGASPGLRRMAERIRISQEDEIALMQRWLRERDLPVPELRVEGTTLAVHGIDEYAHHHEGEHGHAAGGPVEGAHGMLTQAQLDELGEASGSEFDRLFLAFMIRHHRGAVTMVRELFATDGAARDPEMFRLASDIHADQMTEIARMERMLEEMSASDGSG